MHDPRLTPARGDIAAKFLQGKVEAARYVEGETIEIADAIAPLRLGPAADAEQATQALKGERVTIYDRNGEGWAWGQLEADGYVGWLPDAALARPAAAPTHKVTVLRTFAFPGPSIKLPPSDALVMESRLAVVREDGMFAVTREGWFVPKAHLARSVRRDVGLGGASIQNGFDLAGRGDYELGMQDQAFLGPESGLAVPAGIVVGLGPIAHLLLRPRFRPASSSGYLGTRCLSSLAKAPSRRCCPPRCWRCGRSSPSAHWPGWLLLSRHSSYRPWKLGDR